MEKEIDLIIQATASEPYIRFSGGIVYISGRSIPTESTQSFNKLIEAFYKYIQKPGSKTEIKINLDYINSISNRSLLNFLIIAEHLYKAGNDLEVIWYFQEEEDLMHEQALIFDDLLSLPFSIIKHSRDNSQFPA